MLRSTHFLALALLSFIAAATVIAQVNGRLTGTVTDPSGADIAGAAVALYLPGGTTPIATTKTTADGNFDFASLSPGVYTLTVEVSGFTKYTADNVKIDPVRQTSFPPIRMAIQATQATVEVSGSAQSVDTSSVEVNTTVTQEQVTNLPVLDRQVSNLFYTQPGVNSNGRSDTVINGVRAQNTNVTLDGVNIQDNFIRINGIDYIPNKLTIGEVSELTVSTSNLNPSIGGNASAISLSTPSGTDQFHGNAYWYNRNSFLSANDWFNNKDGVSRPFLNLNQFGGSIGGPIKKDKLFFFTTYETYDLHQFSPELTTILTPTARQGILQYLGPTGQVQQFNVLQNPGATPAPLTIDPYIQTLLSQMPTAGNSTASGDQLNTTGYQFNARSNERRDSLVGKLDYNLSPKSAFSATYRWNRDNVDRPDVVSTFSVIPPVSNRNNANLASLSWRFSPTATLTNELRGGANITKAPFDVAGGEPPFLLNTGAPVPSAVGTLFTNPVSTFLPQGRFTDTYNIQDNANWVHGKHSISFGFQTQQIRVHAFNYGGIVPEYALGYSTTNPYGYSPGDIPGANSTAINTANELLADLTGMVVYGAQSFNVTSANSGYVPGAPSTQHISFNDYAGYVSDTWKLSHKLTAILGVRWDYFPPVTEAHGLFLEPQLIDNNPIQTLLSNATLNLAGAPGKPLYHSDLNNFAPNIGLAYDPFGHGKTVIRAGYSINYAQDDLLEGVLNALSINTGLVGTGTVNNVQGRLSTPPSIAAPIFQLPVTTAQNFIATGGNNVQGLVDPNLRTPYVQEWNFGLQHEMKGIVLEASYIGNHAIKLLRQIDYNQININQGGYLQDFINARANGYASLTAGHGFNATYNPAIPGSVALPFFNTLPGSGLLTNSTVASYILNGQAATLAQVYQSNGLLPTNNPNFSFFPNPNALYSSLLTNYSQSFYNGLQLQALKRTRSGLQFQVSYVFSKVLSDTSVERGLDALLDNANPHLEWARAPWDLTHAIKLNHYYPIPAGAGHRFSYRPLNRILGGWGVSGFLTIQSGPPVSILSAYGTLNRSARSGENTVDTNLTLGQLQNITGLFVTGNGPYFVNPANVNPVNGEGIAPFTSPGSFSGQVFYDPGPGTVGQLARRILSGPWFKNYNMAILKDIPITERQHLQLRADFYNLLNHPNFAVGDQNINSVNFGQITSQLYSAEGVGPRLVQFGLFYRF